MTYRRLSFILSALLFYDSICQFQTAQDFAAMDDFVEIDGKLVTRRGLINQISEALEGVVTITEDVLNLILLPIKQLIKLDQDAIIANPHKNDVAFVRIGGPVCEDELRFRDRRFAIVKEAQERFLEMSLDDEDVLEIAISVSGGGVRAKAYSLGAFVGAEKIGLLDTVMCMAGLSGSTWLMAPWISSGQPILEYRERAIKDICDGVNIQDIDDLGPIFDSFWVKFAYNQHLNIIDVYGALLGNNYLRGFGKEQHMVYLSDQQKNLIDGVFPLPIYTAVLGERNMANYWFEFTPFEIGNRWLSANIPSWAFGRKFKGGESKSSAPEMSLGFLMGIFGSAFAASFEEAYEKVIKKIELPSFLEGIPGAEMILRVLKTIIAGFVFNTDLGELRIAWGQVFNYVYKMGESPMHKHDNLKLVDAGVDFNIPIFPTYRKPPYGDAPDVIFIIDVSKNICIEELKIAEAHARRFNFRFPEIDQDDVAERALTIFGKEFDLNVPLIIYLPRVIDPCLLAQYRNNPELFHYVNELKHFDIETAVHSGFARTFSFEYTRKQAELIVDLAEFNIRALSSQIKNILQTRILVKRAERKSNQEKCAPF